MTAERLTFLSGADIDNLPDGTYLLDGLLPDGEVSLLYGQTGQGKTFVALDWALSVATGHPWGSYAVMRQGTVVYVAAEGMRSFKYRKRAWELTHNHGQLVGATFQMPKSAVQLLDPASVDAFLRALDTVPKPIALVVIDTLSRCMLVGATANAETNENNNTDMNRALAAAIRIRDATEAAVLFIHHPNGGGQPRGGTALPAGVEMQVKLTLAGPSRKGAKAGPGTRINLHCDKQKDDEQFEDIICVLDRVDLGAGASSLIVRHEQDAGASSQPDGSTRGRRAYKIGPRVKQARLSQNQVLRCVQAHAAEGISPRDIARELGIVDPGSKVNNHLSALLRDDKVMRTGTGKDTKYFPVEATEAVA